MTRHSLFSLIFASCCGLLATTPARADVTFTQLDVTPTASVMQYHRFGRTRSPGGEAFGLGGAARVHWNDLGFAVAYTGVPTSTTYVDLGAGPATHFIDGSLSYVVARSRRVSGVLEAGPSFAIVDHTFTNGDPARNATMTMLDVPLHATLGGNLGFVLRVHLPVTVLSFGVGYRAGIPVDVPESSYEGALMFSLAAGYEWTR